MIIMRDNARIASGLSPRLAAAAAMLGPAHTVWDVGCDHGFLSAHLITSGAAQNVIATDLSPVSVAKAARLAERRGLSDRMRFAVTDGLSGFEPSGGYKLAVCGMGGELIADILRRGRSVAENAELIVMQPMRGEEELRFFLSENGYSITDETVVLDNGRDYQLIAAWHGGECAIPGWFPKGYYRFGWVMCQKADPVLWDLLQKYRAVYAAQLARAQKAGRTPQKLVDELAAVDTIIDHIRAERE